ncbi:MAG TPA: hypothetical protein VEK32_14890 [Thermodesulfobacteriota bacterium]|nr:hypothetical protein [Thermodesulfobacteriota bacterium]
MSGLAEKFNDYIHYLKPIPLPAKCIVMSDAHAGNGDMHDPLRGSGFENLILDILREYHGKGYTLLKNGDWWDVWRGHDVALISAAHFHLWEIARAYGCMGRLYETLGNHERDCFNYPEALIFEGFGKKIFMWHGAIGDWPNDEGWRVGRFAIRSADQLTGMGIKVDPQTSPHPTNPERHEAVRSMAHNLVVQYPDWDFLWGHTHYFDNDGNNHNSGAPISISEYRGYLIEEGNIIPIRRT